MSAAHAALDACSTQVLSAILIDIGAPEHLSNFTQDDQSDDSILALSFTKPGAIAKKYGLSPTLAMRFVEKCCIAVDSVEPHWSSWTSVAHHQPPSNKARQRVPLLCVV
jgi:hypothetical protein